MMLQFDCVCFPTPKFNLFVPSSRIGILELASSVWVLQDFQYEM